MTEWEGIKIRNMFSMVEDMKKLHATCCRTYDDPKMDEEHKRWALYTGTCIQGLMDGNHINELFDKVKVKIEGTNIDVLLDNNMAVDEARLENKVSRGEVIHNLELNNKQMQLELNQLKLEEELFYAHKREKERS